MLVKKLLIRLPELPTSSLLKLNDCIYNYVANSIRDYFAQFNLDLANRLILLPQSERVSIRVLSHMKEILHDANCFIESSLSLLLQKTYALINNHEAKHSKKKPHYLINFAITTSSFMLSVSSTA